jgi:small ubiquitin-related modifier
METTHIKPPTPLITPSQKQTHRLVKEIGKVRRTAGMSSSGSSMKAVKADGKPAALDKFVTLVVTDDEGRKLTRTMRMTDRLSALVDFYYEMVPTAERGGDGVLLYHRIRIWDRDTPEEYKMKDGDVIRFLPNVKQAELATLVLHDYRGRRFARTVRRTDRIDIAEFYIYSRTVPCDEDDQVSGGGGNGGLVLLYRGQPVSSDQTPEGLGMKDFHRMYIVPTLRGRLFEVPVDTPELYVTIKLRDMQGRQLVYAMRRTEILYAMSP